MEALLVAMETPREVAMQTRGLILAEAGGDARDRGTSGSWLKVCGAMTLR